MSRRHPIALKRVYDPPAAEDGPRYLVDRLWPRGLKKEAVHLTAWVREVAPSAELRKWFGHDPAKWNDFRKRYLQELSRNPQASRPLIEAAKKEKITLLFGAKDTEHNDAVVLRDYLEGKA